MKSSIISLIINSICKKLEIEYNSINSHYVSLMEDAQKLSEIYLQLKGITGTIQEIEDRHELNGLKEKFDNLIKELDIADHDVFKLMRELKDKTNV